MRLLLDGGFLLHRLQGVRQMFPLTDLSLILLLEFYERGPLPFPAVVLLRRGIRKRWMRGGGGCGRGVEAGALLAFVDEAIVVDELPFVVRPI